MQAGGSCDAITIVNLVGGDASVVVSGLCMEMRLVHKRWFCHRKDEKLFVWKWPLNGNKTY